MRLTPIICAIVLLGPAACGDRSTPAPVTYGDGGSERTEQGSVADGGVEAGAPAPPRKPHGVIRAAASHGDLSRAGIHTVRRGETVYGLSRRYEVPIRSIIDANDLSPPYTLYVGQELEIPVPRRHVVQRGETVYSISRTYGVDMSGLTRTNDIQPPYTIESGQVLVIPGESRPQSPDTADAGDEGASTKDADSRDETRLQSASAASPQPKEVPKPPPRTGGRFQWPVSGKVVADFGPQQGGLHNDGINIAAPRGTPIRASENGVVAYVGNELRGFGNLLLIKHADNWVTAYAHTNEVLVRHGQQVKRGQIVARVGSSGSVAKPQLHFEIREGSKARDPKALLGS